MKWLILIVMLLMPFQLQAEEEYFEDWGIRLQNTAGKIIKVSFDEEHTMLVFRIVYMQDGEEIQYEAHIPLYRIWEGEAEGGF